MSRAADRLNNKCRKLYEAKEYEKLFDRMSAYQESAGLLVELIQEDDELGLWWVKFQSTMWDKIFNNPELTEIIEDRARADGFDGMVEFQKQLHQTGFATIEDICRTYGTTPEEIERIVEENPELFKGQRVRMDIQ